ncbi:MAG: hypothetical protein IT331_23630 [Anaerolineae bacterium]|nr:hypothetical protein [Anaerolineae bacterium]
MNPIPSWLWTGGVFGAATITAFVVLQAAVRWWYGHRSQSAPNGKREPTGDNDSMSRRVMYTLLAGIGLVAVCLLVKDTASTLLSVFGIFAVVPYVLLQGRQIEAQRWNTRTSVAHSLDEFQILTVNRQDNSVLDAYPWLEQKLKRNTIFQTLEARFVDLIGQGSAVRGNRAALERIARELNSEDLVQFIRRTEINSNTNDEREIVSRAAEDIAERIHLDAEITIARITGQTMWFWITIVAALLAAVLIPLRVS